MRTNMIKKITYHILNKEQGKTNNVTIEINPNTLPTSNTASELLDQLIARYRGKAGKGYGKFEEDTDNFPISTILEKYLDENNQDDFLKTTERLMNVLKAHIESQAGSKGGKIAFIHYIDDGQDYFLIALLTEKIGLIAKDWGLTQDDILNVDHMRFAGRINLNDWQDVDCERRYISFLKGQGEVSDYFRKFMGCSDALMAKKETQQLVVLIGNFATEQGMSLEKREQLTGTAKSYLEDLSNREEPFFLQVFANSVWPEDPQLFIDSIELNGETSGHSIPDGFIPDKDPLRKLKVFKHRTRHWSMSFDAKAIKDGDIKLREGKIFIDNPPADLTAAFGTNNIE